MNFSQKARKAVAASLAVSTIMWAAAFTVTPVSAAPHSEGCLVNVSGTVYLVTGGQKRGFTSAEVFMSHGYNFGQVVTASSDDADLPTGAIQIYANGTLVKGPNDPLVYLVVNGQKRGFTSGAVFTGLGYSFANIQWAPVNTFTDIPTGSNINSTSETGLPMSGPGPKTVTCGTDNDSDTTLDGTAGSVASYTLKSGVSNEEVGEGEDDVEVAGLTIEADDGSDLRFTAVKLVFDEGTAGSDFEDYASEVNVLWNGNVVATEDASEFDDDNEWTKTLALASSAVLDMEEEGDLTVELSGISNLDSGDVDDTWTVDFRQVRYVDAQGAVTTEDPTEDPTTFSFTSFASAADIELIVGEADPDDNDARVLDIDDVDNTDDVEVFWFTLEADGDSDLMIEALPITVNTVETTGNDPDDLIATYYLYQGDTEVGSESNPAADTTDDSTTVVVFDDLDVTIDAGETEDFSVKMEFVSTADALDAGDTVAVVFGETQTDLSTFEVEDEEGNELVDADKTGTTTGGVHELRHIGINLELVSTDAEISSTSDGTATVSDAGTFVIEIDVTAFDGDVYIDKTAPTAAGGATESDLAITGAGTVVASITSISGATEGTNGYLVEEGTTETFQITVNITATTSGFFAVELDNLLYALTDVDGDLGYTFGLADYKTGQVFLRDF